MKYRTDLAIETEQLLTEARQQASGYIKKQSQIDKDISVTEIIITTEEGEKAFGRDRGTYITVEVDGILEGKEDIKKRAARALAAELKKYIKFDYFLKVLVVGLGNEKVTPDSLGPHTVDKVKITSHLFRIFECEGDWEMANVSGFNPSVTGVTGMETADLIEKTVSLVKPDYVVIIDSLAAKEMGRMNTTIQMCDTGIAPGAGMGNNRREISEKTIGCKVISLGVPTVIDSRTLLLEAAEETGGWDPEEYIKKRDMDMIVTSTDIDQIIKDFSDIIADAINITLHPGIYS
ncbi:MAG: GPR endopeptidase [Firmicutes bacterium]|nr:GPR endopeptidase [Bacillota bacterium]